MPQKPLQLVATETTMRVHSDIPRFRDHMVIGCLTTTLCTLSPIQCSLRNRHHCFLLATACFCRLWLTLTLRPNQVQQQVLRILVSTVTPFPSCRCSLSQTTNHTSVWSHLLSLQTAGFQCSTSDCLRAKTACTTHPGVRNLLLHDGTHLLLLDD
jgi:hypothetical protein